MAQVVEVATCGSSMASSAVMTPSAASMPASPFLPEAVLPIAVSIENSCASCRSSPPQPASERAAATLRTKAAAFL